MSFDVYTQSGMHFIMWFDSVEKLLESMLENPNDTYHRKN